MLRDHIVGLCALALLGGCAASQQARNVETAGFLGDDYALLRETARRLSAPGRQQNTWIKLHPFARPA